MRGNTFGYFRLILASWLFLGGMAFQFWPSEADVQRESRARERTWRPKGLSIEQKDAQGALLDEQDARNQLLLRLGGIFLGGIGFAVVLHEAACIAARFNRDKDLS